MRVMKDRISFSYAERDTITGICIGVWEDMNKLTSPHYKILPEDFLETNEDAKKIFLYSTIRCGGGRCGVFPSDDPIYEFINIQGIKMMKTCVSLDRKCIDELYMSLTELFTFLKLHLDKFIPHQSTHFRRNGNHVQTIVETKEQSWFYQMIAHYLRLFSIYLNKAIPFKEGRERMLALDEEGPQIKCPIVRNLSLKFSIG